MKQKLFSMLALLLVAVSGAWADSFSADAYAANATLNGVSVTANQTVTINEGVTVTVNNGLSIQSNATLTVTGGGTLVVNGANGADGQNEGIGVDPDMGEEVWVNATPGSDGNSGIVIDNGGNLIISNATIIAVGGKGGQGGKFEDESYAANGADGNGFASFPTIDGAVMSHSTNGTDYTEYASSDKTLYRYMKAVAAAAPTGYSVTMAEGTEDGDKWTVKVGEGKAQAFPVEGLNGGETVTATYSGEKKVKSVKAVKKAPAVNPNAYLKWNADQKKLVATEIPESFTTVTSSTTTWSAGTYVVEGQVKIDGSITLNGEVNLIIKDGAKLTANKIVGANKNLSIYGQAQKSGELVVDNSGDDAITSIKTLEVHSAKVTATSSKKDRGGFYYTRTINVYDGSVDATAANGYGIWLTVDGSINIYGGEVKAVGKGTGNDSYGIKAGGSATVTVNGGKLWAENANKQALQSNVTLKKGEGFTGKIEYSSDKSTWSETVDADAKYVRAGY